MKKRSLSVLAAVGAPLVLAGSASAGYVGITVRAKEAPPGKGPADGVRLFVCNVYAVFDRTDDEMVAVAGTPQSPLDIHVLNGKFYQDMQGQPLTAPAEGMLPGMSGILAFDTFVTIGVKTQNLSQIGDEVSTTPGLTFENDIMQSINDSWFIVPSGAGNGGIGAPNQQGEVLIFQGSFDLNAGGTGIDGAMLLQFTSNGVSSQQSYETFSHSVPAPGALALLGGAGLLSRRRRRKA